jgi:KUP system potassium uptake protein
VVPESFLSIENELSLKQGIFLKYYFFLKKLGLSARRAFGLEKCDVVVEQVPLVCQPATNKVELVRQKIV